MKDIFNEVLNFIYGIAHLIGNGIAKVILFIFPNIELPPNIIDALGFLSVLTIFLIIFHFAKKIAWIIVVIGWVFLLIRIIMIVLKV
jgi:hypothetical protein